MTIIEAISCIWSFTFLFSWECCAGYFELFVRVPKLSLSYLLGRSASSPHHMSFGTPSSSESMDDNRYHHSISPCSYVLLEYFARLTGAILLRIVSGFYWSITQQRILRATYLESLHRNDHWSTWKQWKSIQYTCYSLSKTTHLHRHHTGHLTLHRYHQDPSYTQVHMVWIGSHAGNWRER